MSPSNAQSAEFDQLALDIAGDLFGTTPRLRRCNSGCNYCLVLSFDDGRADRVLKLSNNNDWAIEFERCLYPAMRAYGIPVPEIEFSRLDYSRPAEPFIVMPKFSDHTLHRLCQTDPAAAIPALEKSGRFVAEFHPRFAEPFKPFVPLEELNGLLAVQQRVIDRMVSGAINLSPIRDTDPALARQIEDHLATLKRTKEKRLAHGVFHAQNILADPGGEICIVDFGESIGMSSPFNDLTVLMLWAEGQEQIDAILRGYGEIDADEVEEYRFWEFYNGVGDVMHYLRYAPGTERTQKRIERVRGFIDGHSLLPGL